MRLISAESGVQIPPPPYLPHSTMVWVIAHCRSHANKAPPRDCLLKTRRAAMHPTRLRSVGWGTDGTDRADVLPATRPRIARISCHPLPPPIIGGGPGLGPRHLYRTEEIRARMSERTGILGQHHLGRDQDLASQAGSRVTRPPLRCRRHGHIPGPPPFEGGGRGRQELGVSGRVAVKPTRRRRD